MSSSCIEPESLQPFIFIILGIWIQYWINFIIDERNNKPKSKEKDTGTCKSCWNSFKKVLPTILLLYQIASMLMTFYLDITQLRDYHINNYSNSWPSLAKTYNCYTQIIIVSSNAKRSFSLGISLGAWLYTRCFLKHRDDFDDKNDIEMGRTDNHQRTDTVDNTDSEQVKTCWDCINKPLNWIRWILATIYLIVFFPSFFTHGIIAMGVFIWICLAIYGLCLLISIIVYMFRKCCDNKYWDLIGGGVEIEAFCVYLRCCCRKKSWNPDKMDIKHHKVSLKGWASPLSFTAALLAYTVVVLAVSYWYGGDRYLEAITRVYNERKISDYFKNMVNSAIDGFKLFTAIF